MSTYVIKHGELYHARRLSNMSAGSVKSKIPDMNTLTTMLRKHIASQENRPVTDIEVSNVKIREELLSCTLHFKDDNTPYFYGMHLSYLLNKYK